MSCLIESSAVDVCHAHEEHTGGQKKLLALKYVAFKVARVMCAKYNAAFLRISANLNSIKPRILPHTTDRAKNFLRPAAASFFFLFRFFPPFVFSFLHAAPVVHVSYL